MRVEVQEHRPSDLHRRQPLCQFPHPQWSLLQPQLLSFLAVVYRVSPILPRGASEDGEENVMGGGAVGNVTEDTSGDGRALLTNVDTAQIV